MARGSAHELPPKCTASAEPCGTSRALTKFSIEQHQEPTGGTSPRAASPSMATARGSSTLECRRPNRNLILNGRSLTCGPGFQTTESFLTSRAASTSRGEAFGPFWTPACRELSRKSWLPTVTASPGSTPVSLNTSCTKGEPFSQSLKIVRATDVPRNSQKTSWRCSHTSPPSTTDEERIVVRKIQLYPDTDQKHAFETLFGADRYFWNSTKSIADKTSQEALEARVSELVSDHDDGVCHQQGCSATVVEHDGGHFSKKRWYCADHLGDSRFDAKPRLVGRSGPWEQAYEASAGTCTSEGCDVDAVSATLRCARHQQDGKKDPRMPSPKSPYNFEAVKSHRVSARV